jgi:hypothetical protein
MALAAVCCFVPTRHDVPPCETVCPEQTVRSVLAQFTAVRAPTNASFDKLPDRIIAMQRKPEHLTRALTYHDRMLMSRRSATSRP